MLDTRHVGRDRQVDYGDYVSGGVIDPVAVRAATGDSSRTMLGDTQRDWLKAGLTDSTARWQVLGQQVLMARQPLTEPIVRALNSDLAGDDPLGEATAAVLTAVAAKSKPPAERTPEEQALLDTAIPFNPDAWDGYAFEREDILTHAAQLQSRLVVLAGDTHNGWASQLTTADGTPVGVEFGGPGVSSPGAEDVIGLNAAQLFAPFAVLLMDDLKYTNLVSRGYMAVTFMPEAVTCDYRYVDTVRSREYVVDAAAARSFTVARGDLLLA
jgi:alkaline phosphatase D